MRLPRVRQRSAGGERRTGSTSSDTRAAMAELVGVPIEIVDLDAAARAAPARLDGRPARGRIPADRRARRPELADERVRRGDAGAARPPPHAGDGARAGKAAPGRSRRPRATSGPRSSSTPRASGRARWRGSRARAADRLDAAPLRRHGADRGDRRARARAAGAARPGGVVLRAPGGRRPAGRPVRARPEAVGARRDPRGLPRPAPPARPRPDRGAARRRGRARARIRDAGIRTVDQRPRRLHARRPLPDGPGARTARTSMCWPASASSGSSSPAAPGATPPSGSSTASRATTCGSSTCGGSAPTRPRSRTSSPRARDVYEREYAIHYPEEELPAGRPLKTDPLYDRLAARGAVFGLALRLGAAAVVLEGRAGARRVLVPARQLVRRGRRGVPRGSLRRRRARPDELREVPRRRARGGGVARPRLREQAPGGAGAHRADAGLPAGRRDRVRPDRHAARARTPSTSSPRRRPSCTTSRGCRHSSPATTCSSRT